jgi:rod shape-determining protein MreC
MFADHRLHALEDLRAALSVAIHPLQLVAQLPGAAGRWLDERLASRQALQEQNQSLRDQLLRMDAQMHKFEALEAENARLKDLLGSARTLGERTLVAEIVDVALDPNNHQILINKGTHAGVTIGQPILDAHGVMGQIVHVSPYTASALLITDPNHALPVRINRNGLRTIATGSGARRRLTLPHLPANADIRTGDLLVTSGLGGRFPADYPVGVVQHVEQDSARPFARVEVAPSARLDTAREVLLLWPAREVHLPTAPATPPAPASLPVVP